MKGRHTLLQTIFIYKHIITDFNVKRVGISLLVEWFGRVLDGWGLELAKAADETARQLTRSLMQAMGLLGMYHAELARVLHVHCADVGLLASGQHFLAPGSSA